MHFADPVAQAVDDQSPDNRLVRIQRIAAAGVVGVARLVLRQDVVGLVSKTAKAEGRTLLVALGRMVKDDVEDDFDPGVVQCLDHIAKFVDAAERLQPRTVPGMWSKKR